jgi:Flp pilus assembly protein TadB
VGRLGQQRDGVGEPAAERLDQREAAEDQQRDLEASFARLIAVCMSTVTVAVVVMRLVRMPVRVIVPVGVMVMGVRHAWRPRYDGPARKEIAAPCGRELR